jgi:DNA-binding XRE family transcriptional regulator
VTQALDTFLRLPREEKKNIEEQVRRAKDPALPKAEREKAMVALCQSLGLSAGDPSDGLPVSKEERLTAAHLEVRKRMDDEEAVFARNLELLMAQRQLTQTELAQRIGVGQSAISMLLKRRCRPQRKTLGKLAAALGVEVEALWPGFRESWDL